jgi:hypothetical protein
VFKGCGFNAKVVDDEAEHDVAPHVPPEAKGVLTMMIPFCIQIFLEEFVGQYAGLGKTIHAHFDFHIDPSLLVNDVM